MFYKGGGDDIWTIWSPKVHLISFISGGKNGVLGIWEVCGGGGNGDDAGDAGDAGSGGGSGAGWPVADHGEGNCVQHMVDRGYHLRWKSRRRRGRYLLPTTY